MFDHRVLAVLVIAMACCLLRGFPIQRAQRATYSLRRLSSIDPPSDSNAIKWIYQSKLLGVIFKSSGVTIGSDNTNNKTVRRTSKVSIEGIAYFSLTHSITHLLTHLCIEEHLKQKNIAFNCADNNILSVWDSGLIVVGLTSVMRNFIKNCNRKYTFTAILASDTLHAQDLHVPLGGIISEQKVIRHVNSSSHGSLYLVQFETKEFTVTDDATTILPAMRKTLSTTGMSIVDKYISLIGVTYTVPTSSGDRDSKQQVRIDISEENSDLNTQEFAIENVNSLEVIYQPPAKFMKYIKREELAFSRLASNTPTTIDNTIIFRDLSLTYGITSLRPRESSGVIVDACNKYLASADNPAILELGCASGALILSILNENKGSNITGLGMDIDKNSLKYARENAKMNSLDTKITFLEGDFTKLHLNEALAPASGEGQEGFRVIVSNPPYFDPQKISNRVTTEGIHTLAPLGSSGDGLVYYEEILQSINAFHSRNKRPLLHPTHGVVVFQIPGNKLSYSKVKEIIERNGFSVLEIVYDKRARDGDASDLIIRGIVCRSSETSPTS